MKIKVFTIVEVIDAIINATFIAMDDAAHVNIEWHQLSCLSEDGSPTTQCVVLEASAALPPDSPVGKNIGYFVCEVPATIDVTALCLCITDVVNTDIDSWAAKSKLEAFLKHHK